MSLKCIVSSPVDTYSGYGARARDFIKALISIKKEWDIYLLSQRWGDTRTGYLSDHNEIDLMSRIVPIVGTKPDIFIQITVPNEFQKIGRFNIGVTAGIETTLCDSSWITGCNNMDLVITSSQHSLNVFKTSKYNVVDSRTNENVNLLEINTPLEVLFEGVDTEKYYNSPSSRFNLKGVQEDFCFLVVGHWLPGEFGHDRKNLGYTVKTFLEVFKNLAHPPALLLKTQGSTTSIMDREAILSKINSIRRTVKGTLPNIYLIHGEVSDEEMNDLYNHPKVKAMISLTKGEGFGRPLLEFAAVGKPIIASGWSGHLDFLNPEQAILIGGVLENVHPSAAMKNALIEEAKWFKPNEEDLVKAYKMVHTTYSKVKTVAKPLAKDVEENFSLEKMKEVLHDILERRVPNLPEKIELKLPELPILQKVK